VIGTLHLGAAEWRCKLGIAALPAAFFLPRWLAKKGHIDEAREVLRITGGENCEQGLQDIVASIDVEHHAGDSLLNGKYGFPIFLPVSIAMFNQLSGINAILYYLNQIFAQAGFNKISSDLRPLRLAPPI
jgi:SP family arabinose:H+ symporter-like MFS transporter